MLQCLLVVEVAGPLLVLVHQCRHWSVFSEGLAFEVHVFGLV